MRGKKPGRVVELPSASAARDVTAAEIREARKSATRIRPRELDDAAKKIWSYIAPRLILLGRLTPETADALGEYCVALAEVRALRDAIKAEGRIVESEGRYGEQHAQLPARAAVRQSLGALAQSCRSLWGDPSRRPRDAGAS